MTHGSRLCRCRSRVAHAGRADAPGVRSNTDGVDIADVRSESTAIGSRVSSDYPDTNTKIRPVVRSRTGGFDPTNPWDAMLAAVVCELLIGCANVANLSLARGVHRSREIGIRTALGASRWRIARQLMVENLLLAILAGVLGLGVASLGVHLWVGAMLVANWPYRYRFTIDRQVLAYLAQASLASAMLFGVAPALKIATTAPGPHMRDGGRGATPGASAQRWTSGLLVADFALTLALLAGAGRRCAPSPLCFARTRGRYIESVARLVELAASAIRDGRAAHGVLPACRGSLGDDSGAVAPRRL